MTTCTGHYPLGPISAISNPKQVLLRAESLPEVRSTLLSVPLLLLAQVQGYQ